MLLLFGYVSGNMPHCSAAGDVQYWRAEEDDMIEELQRELLAKEETIKALKEQLASIEHEEYKKEREIDILRQSLRILSSKKPSRITKNVAWMFPSVN